MYKSQIGQDKWVQSVLKDKRHGFFIEMGACDGTYFSNTYFFEKERDWNGICIEPNPVYHTDLIKNRNCRFCFNAISDRDKATVDFVSCSSASGIKDTAGPFTKSDKTIQVETMTMSTLLKTYNAPKTIDYFSLDVEGHEYEVMKNFPFKDYTIQCLTVEHNEPHVGSEMRMKLRTLFEQNGYIFVKGNDDVQGWGHGPIDDFYVHSSVVLA
jgi:FkbM family methyltransferase